MEKKLYEAPRLSAVGFLAEDALLASAEGLTEEEAYALSGGAALVFRKDGSVNIFG